MRAMGPAEAGALRYQLESILAVIDPRISDAVDMDDRDVIRFSQTLRQAAQIAAYIEGRDADPTPPVRRGVKLAKIPNRYEIEKETWNTHPSSAQMSARN